MKRLLRALLGLYLCLALLSAIVVWAAWEPQHPLGLAGYYVLLLLGWPWSQGLLAFTRQGNGFLELGAGILFNLSVLLWCLRRFGRPGTPP